jgi:hypothetical protein
MCRARFSRISSKAFVVLRIKVATRARHHAHRCCKNRKQYYGRNYDRWKREALMRPKYPHMLSFYYTENHLAIVIMA